LVHPPLTIETGMTLEFDRTFDAPYQKVIRVAPRIRRLLVRNPGPFTFKGTGVTLVGDCEIAVIDPGPDDPEHLAALREAIGGETVSHILVTHTHRDHSPAARALREWTGAKIYGFGPHGGAAREGGAVVEEAGDTEFAPDVTVRDRDTIEGNCFALQCVHTPGHTSNHMCYALLGEKALFTGDHVMGWSTSVVVPPDGDMADYLRSLRKLLARDDAVYWPTHGGPIRDPRKVVSAYLEHREARDAQILACLKDGLAQIPDMVSTIYAGLDPRLKPAAGLTILAHLIQMVRDGRAICEGEPRLNAHFHAI